MLLNAPSKNLSASINFDNTPLGILYSLDEQCRLILGNGSNYQDCTVSSKTFENLKINA